jgi:hypothetical protein
MRSSPAIRRLSTVRFATVTADAHGVSVELAIDTQAAEPPHTNLRDALMLLGAVVACIYALDAATLAGFNAREAAVFVAIAGVQGAWLAAARHLRNSALVTGAGLNAALVALWVLSRTVGLPFVSGGPLPVGILDALCAVDSAAVAVIAATLALRAASPPAWSRSAPRWGAVALATASLAALHVHGSSSYPAARIAGGNAAAPYHFFCQLL